MNASFSAHVTTCGDRSVGIWPDHLEVVFHGYPEVRAYGVEREALRVALKDAFEPLTDAFVGVCFSDECPSCGALRKADGPCRCETLGTDSP